MIIWGVVVSLYKGKNKNAQISVIGNDGATYETAKGTCYWHVAWGAYPQRGSAPYGVPIFNNQSPISKRDANRHYCGPSATRATVSYNGGSGSAHTLSHIRDRFRSATHTARETRSVVRHRMSATSRRRLHERDRREQKQCNV